MDVLCTNIAKCRTLRAKAKSMEQRVNRHTNFRFEDLEIWQLAIEIAEILFDIPTSYIRKNYCALQNSCEGVAISMPNNIAEGSGSTSKKEFIQFLNFARRSTLSQNYCF